MKNQKVNFWHTAISSLIAVLIAFMLGVVVYDRYMYHNLVCKAALSDIIMIKEKQRESIIDSLNFSKGSSIINISVSHQSNNKTDNLSDLLQKSDGLINANGLTYLVTLIIALLASLLLTKIDVMEKAIDTNRDLKNKVKKSVNSNNQLGIKLNKSLDESQKQRNKLQEIEEKTESYYHSCLLKTLETPMYKGLGVSDF